MSRMNFETSRHVHVLSARGIGVVGLTIGGPTHHSAAAQGIVDLDVAGGNTAASSTCTATSGTAL